MHYTVDRERFRTQINTHYVARGSFTFSSTCHVTSSVDRGGRARSRSALTPSGAEDASLNATPHEHPNNFCRARIHEKSQCKELLLVKKFYENS